LTAPFKGIIDDFAVFASALTEEQIIALSEGNTDILPEKREIEVPLPDIPILLSKSPTGAAAAGVEAEISLRFRGIDFTDLSITVNDKAVDLTITSDGSFTTITADGAFSLGKNVIALTWNGESKTWNFFQFPPAGEGGLVAHWPLNESSGDVFKDVMGGFDGFLPLAENGAQTEISWSDGPPTQQNSVEFSGVNSFIATPFTGMLPVPVVSEDVTFVKINVLAVFY